MSKHEYNSDEVSQIIKVALRQTNDDSKRTISHDELLTIGKDLGLNAVDLKVAEEHIRVAKEDGKTGEKAWNDFRLHVVCYIAGALGLLAINTYINLTHDQTFFWAFLAIFAYAPVVAVHGYIARKDPHLARSLFYDEDDENARPAARATHEAK